MRTPRYWHWLASAVVLLAARAEACPRPDCIRVGSWNIEWLGSEHRSQPSDARTLEAMAQLLAGELSMDLVTLQEINTGLEGKIQGEHFRTQPWTELRRALEKQGYQTFSGSSGYAQQVVLAWRAPVTLRRSPYELAIPDQFDLGEFCRSSRLRKPLAAQFKAGQLDFWFVGLHLKSSAGQANCSSAIRLQQSRLLATEVRKLQDSDRDVILAGDFNASQQNDTLRPLLDAGFHALHHRKLRNPASNNISYHSETARKPGSGSLVDHILVSSRHTKEWIAHSPTIYKPEDAKKFANTYSDHLPIWVDFNTTLDDD